MKVIIKLLVVIILTSYNTCDKNKSSLDNKEKERLLAEKKEMNQSNTLNKEYKQLSTDKINRLLTKSKRELTASEVMRLYYPYEVEGHEGNEKIEILEEIIDNSHTIITLIHDNFLDDSVRGEKYRMELKKINSQWIVISIKKNWKCWDGRGHTDWGIERCR